MPSAMAAASPPIEWIRGRPREAWFLGSFLAILTISIPASLLYSWFVPLSRAYLEAYSLGSGLVVGFSIYAGLTAYYALFPMPLAGIGISPGELVVDYGLRRERVPWSRAFLAGDQLLLVSTRFGFVTRYRLTPYQAARVAYLRPKPD